MSTLRDHQNFILVFLNKLVQHNNQIKCLNILSFHICVAYLSKYDTFQLIRSYAWLDGTFNLIVVRMNLLCEKQVM